eukprot:6079096-Amphidinium_carterae.1
MSTRPDSVASNSQQPKKLSRGKVVEKWDHLEHMTVILPLETCQHKESLTKQIAYKTCHASACMARVEVPHFSILPFRAIPLHPHAVLQWWIT